MIFDKPITVQHIDPDTEQWSDLWSLHARVNAKSGSEFTEAGATNSQSIKYFDIRYFAGIEAMDYNRAAYRIVYRGNTFNIVDYDDFMERHKVVKVKGVSYGT